MKYKFRYDVGPMYSRRRSPGKGLVGALLSVLAFLAQLVVWVVLAVAGLVYTIVWIILWPFERLLGGGRRH